MTLEYAKSNKLTYLVYAKSLQIEESIKNNLIWTARIRSAIQNNRILPYFQAIYNNSTKEIDRYEVLIRLVDENGKVHTPDKFLDIAKKANLYKQLTKIVIDKSFDYFDHSDYKFSINLSAEDIVDKNTRHYIYKKLEQYPNSSHVIFEIVESECIENYDEVRDFISNCKQYGIEIAIDDLGTGFSNFMNLSKLDVDIIKIDGSIIQLVLGENTAAQVTETIVDFANKVGVKTVAEFVSDKDIFLKINTLGISFSQGYYVSKPMENIV
jgi:EAL domain-containing protein (putative c-di-GMP-specific phosphodiesterase class I)